MVAIKILRETVGMTEIARQRFKREGQAEGALVHPNVVAVYDAGEVGGRPYLVMELVEGQPLGDLMLARKFAEKEIVDLVEKAARGVSAAHAKGIVHRDLKPQNILLTPEGEPKVGDFGLAHLAASAEQLTRTGATLGTPLYMAPEQVKGSAKQITPRTDVYALGVLLYELLSGQPPHLGETLVEIYRKIAEEEPAPLRSRVDRISRDLETIIQTAIDKDPARRYPDAGALADDLARYRAGEAIQARPLTVADQLLRKAARHRWVLLSCAAAVLLSWVGALWIHSSQSKLLFLEAPQLEQAKGTVAWIMGDAREAATIGRRLLPGEGLESSGQETSAILRYGDLTSVELGSDTRVRRPSEVDEAVPGGAKEGKRMDLESGTVWIKGRAGLKTQPMILATRLATLELGEGEHRVRATPTSTILEVHSGNGKAIRRKDGRAVVVETDRCVTIEEDGALEPKAIARSRREAFTRSGGVDSSLLGYWKLDEGKGAVAEDSSGHGRAAKVIGTPLWREGSILLDGKGTHVELPSDEELSHLEESAYSFSLWYKPADTPAEVFGAFGAIHGLLTKGPWRFGLLYTRDHTFVMQHYLQGEGFDVKRIWGGTGTWGDVYGPGRWYHVVSVVDRENGTTLIYVDAHPRIPSTWSKNQPPQAFSTAPWRIGALEHERGKTAFFAKGEIADVRIYTRVLDQEEITIIHQAGRARLKK
jgi:predicted Ser/Thr protein kinase